MHLYYAALLGAVVAVSGISELVLLSDPSAKCLDGSSPGYYGSREGAGVTLSRTATIAQRHVWEAALPGLQQRHLRGY